MGYKLQVGDIIEDGSFIDGCKWEVHEITECGKMVILRTLVGIHPIGRVIKDPHYRDWDRFVSEYGGSYILHKSKSSNFNTLYEKLNDNN